jgi:tRNA nucleotidyltransferase/poly(A) polymerase
MATGDKSALHLDLRLPDEVRAVAEQLREPSNGQVYLVGGAVRDALRGTDPAIVDWDFATPLPPDRLAELLPDADARDLGLGVLRLTAGSHDISVGSFREEGLYRDRRHPDRVRFVPDLESDARRRDFTVNAIYVDPWQGCAFDPCNGLADLQAGMLRAIGEPVARFDEDPLRVLRAVRCAAKAELEVEPATRRALEASAALLRSLARERVLSSPS